MKTFFAFFRRFVFFEVKVSRALSGCNLILHRFILILVYINDGIILPIGDCRNKMNELIIA